MSFTLQGDADRLGAAVAAVRDGTKRSSNIQVDTVPAAIDPALTAFTILGWTSTTRHITNPYDLVFKLRDDNGELSPAEVKQTWHGILRSTLIGDDLNKLGPND